MSVRNALFPRKVQAHSHTVQFEGEDIYATYSTVDYFDGTCPICHAHTTGVEPRLAFVQPLPGGKQTWLTPIERFRRWRFWLISDVLSALGFRGGRKMPKGAGYHE